MYRRQGIFKEIHKGKIQGNNVFQVAFVPWFITRSSSHGKKLTLIEKWEKITRIEVKEVKIRKMKTRWGSCKTKQKRVWLNLELAKKPLHCIEYVLVHELAHIVEKKHDAKFKSLMTSFMPNWKQYKHELNYAKLGFSKWELVA